MALIPANRIFHYVAPKPGTVKDILRDHFKVTPEKAEELLQLGAIYSNKQRIFEDQKIVQGAYLRLHLHPKRFEVATLDWRSRLLKETHDFIIINKPQGVPTHATVDNALENCLAQMRNALGTELFVTQRLDTPVGGILLFAKTKQYQTQFNRWLSERKIKKTYLALVEQSCQLGRHTHWMGPSERSPKVLAGEPKPNWLSCELTVLSCSPKGFQNHPTFQVEVDLHTGRTHQIRAQLAFLGSPILGDRLYGSRIKGYGSHRIALISKSLKWPQSEFIELKEPYEIME